MIKKNMRERSGYMGAEIFCIFCSIKKIKHMKYLEFENHIKNEVYNSTAFVDTNALIAGIHSEKNNAGRKKWLFLFIMVILAFSIPFGIYNYNNKSSKIIPFNKKSEDKEIQNKELNSSPSVVSNLTKKEAIEEKPITKTKKKALNVNTIISNKREKNNFINTKKENKPTLVNTTQISKNKDIKAKKENLEYTSKDLKTRKLLNIPDINNNNYSLIENFKTRKILKTKSLWGDPTGCYSFGPKFRLNWLIGVEAGILKPFKSLSYRSVEPNEVFDIRNAYEKPLEGLQAAIFTKLIRDDIPLYAKLGVSYTRITDRLKHKYSYIEHDTIQGIISVTKSENGDTLTVIMGDIIRDINIERNLSQHYYFHLIDIPFTLGYRFPFKNFSLEAELGAIFNIRTGKTGKILSAPKTILPVTDANMFKNSIGFSYFAGINLITSVSYKGEMFISARFRYIPGNFNISGNPIKQNYSLAGFHIGYLYNLTKRGYD